MSDVEAKCTRGEATSSIHVLSRLDAKLAAEQATTVLQHLLIVLRPFAAKLCHLTNDERVSNPEGKLLYTGVKTIILRITFTTYENKKVSTIVAVSRDGAQQSVQELKSDGIWLHICREFLSTKLGTRYKCQYRVIEVVHEGDIELSTGETFAFHCSEPVVDAAGIHIKYLTVTVKNREVGIPYYSYIHPHSNDEMAANQARQAEAQAKLDWLVARASGLSKLSLADEPITPISNQDRNDMIKMLILMHLGSGGFLPREMSLAAGDFMAILKHQGGLDRITLTTFRGGPSVRIPSLATLFYRIIDHQEPYYDGFTIKTFKPFAGISFTLFVLLVAEVETMLGLGVPDAEVLQ